MLILFDIDGTLVRSRGLGFAAIVEAGQSLFGDGFHGEGVEFAGRIDPLILADILAANGLEPTAERVKALREGYVSGMFQRAEVGTLAEALPGVQSLLGVLEQDSEIALGLLTGNYEETGELKLRCAGVDPDRFEVRVWGDDAPGPEPTREALGPVGMERYERARGSAIEPKRVVIVGDTPHDVTCARASGFRVLAVETGMYGRDELADADRVMPDLSNTEEVHAWLTNP